MTTSTKHNRRSFLRHASAFAFAIPLIELGAFGSLGCRTASSSASFTSAEKAETLQSKTTIVAAGEPGEPLIVSGAIFAPDGKTPMEGIKLFVYQTDATGRYSTTGGDNRNTRIHGAMQTDGEGRYEFRTIRPVSYPGTRIPQHIHAYVSGPGYSEYWIQEYHFADDPFITEEMRLADAQGSFASILNLQKESDGTWRGRRDIKLERCAKNCTGH